MKNKARSSGFTMIETIIAFAVMTAAIIGPVALIAFSLSRIQSSQNKLIATNLGQEGLELVRAIRENNVICDILSSPPPVQWDNNPNSAQRLGQGGNNQYTVDANNTITQTCGSVSFPTPKPITYANCNTDILGPNNKLNLNASQQYTHGPGTPTPFRRCITICVPATSAPCNGANDPDVGAASDQMEVISRVFWLDHGLQRSIQFQERLYNWR